MVERVSSVEWVLILLVFAAYAVLELVLYPAFAPADWDMRVGGADYFQAPYSALQAYLIAYPVAGRFLKSGRYVWFFVLAVAILGIFAYVDELLIEKHLFEDAFVWHGVYYEAAETGTLAVLFLAVRLLWSRNVNERRLEQLARANAEAELRYLRAQMNPHVLFNALNNIYSFALQRSEATPGLILKLADALRYMTYECADEATLLEKEISYLRDSVDLQKLAIEGRGGVGFNVSGDARGKRLAPFLLIPFIENCFKHSMDTKERAIDISIDIEIGADNLRLKCRNVYDQAAASKSGERNRRPGVGLANVRRRLELLFGDRYT